MKICIGRVAIGFLSLGLFVSAQTPSVKSSVASANKATTGTAALSGGGEKDYVPLWLAKSRVGDLIIYQQGKNVGIGTTSPQSALDVSGAVNASTSFNLGGSLFAFGSARSRNAFLGF